MKQLILGALYAIGAVGFAAPPAKTQPLPPKFNPVLAPRKDDSFTLQFEGEFLYLRPFNSTLDYMVDGVGVANVAGTPAINVPSTGTLYRPNYRFQPGFRVSAAGYFGRNNVYDATARYTRIHTSAIGHYDANKRPELVETAEAAGSFLIENNQGRVTFHNADIDVHYPQNFLDLVGGYSIDVGQNIYFRPFAGLSGYWTSVAIHVNYAFFNPTAPAGEEAHHFHSKAEGRGIGPIVGFDVNWNIVKYLSLFGSFDFAIRYLNWDLRGHEQEVRLTAGGVFDITRGKIHAKTMGLARSMLLGPQFDIWFKNKYHMTLRAGWEWISLDAVYLSYLDTSVAATFFASEIQGLNASASFEF